MVLQRVHRSGSRYHIHSGGKKISGSGRGTTPGFGGVTTIKVVDLIASIISNLNFGKKISPIWGSNDFHLHNELPLKSR